MNNYINNVKHVFTFAFVAMLSALQCVQAENKLYIQDFSIVPGETAQVEVLLENSDPISSLQFDMILPEGVEFADYSTNNEGKIVPAESTYPRNAKRLVNHALALTPSTVTLEDGTVVNAVRCSILEQAVDPAKAAIKLSEGALFTMELEASDVFQGGDFVITEVGAVNNTTAEYKPVEIADYTASVAPKVASYGFDPLSVEIKNDEVKTITFNLDNSTEILGLRAFLTIPEGLEIVPDENGSLFTKCDDRLAPNIAINENLKDGRYVILIESITGDKFKGNEGGIFTMNVKATKAEKYEAKIKIEDVEVSSGVSSYYKISANEGADEVTVAVSAVPGDASGDGEVDITDVQTVVKAVNEGSTETVLYDINGDGEIDISDVIMIISIINNQ